jgi:hypothetical protein
MEDYVAEVRASPAATGPKPGKRRKRE